jgi:hypothetical protein
VIENSDPPDEDVVPSPDAFDSTSSQTKAAREIEPTLTAFFGEKEVRTAPFLAAVRKAKVSRFQLNDETAAWELMKTHDAEGERLWSLASQASLPDAIEHWIWPAAQGRLASIFGEKFAPLHQTSSETLASISGFIISETSNDGPPELNNWGRIGIRWLIEQRSIDAWQVADSLYSRLFPRASDARKLATKAIARGRTADLRLVVATVGLAKWIVENAKRALDTEQRLGLNLRAQLSQANEREQALQADVSRLESQLAVRSSELLSARSDLEAERHHSGHELTETIGAQQALLRERLQPLLLDAIDALEIDPPAPEVARRRLKNVIELIEKADE